MGIVRGRVETRTLHHGHWFKINKKRGDVNNDHPKKEKKIKKYLEDGKTWEYIRNKIGVSNDGINNIRREPSSSLTSTISQADKTTRVDQDPTIQKQQPPTTKNTTDSHVLHLEQKISNVDQGLRTNNQQLQNVVEILNQLKQSQQTQETKEPLPEKPDNQPNLRELTHQETKSLPSTITQVQQPNKNQDQIDAPPQKTKIDPPFSLDFNVEQTSEVDSDQTDEFPQERKREYIEVQPYHIKAGLEILREIKKQYDAYKHYQQTGVYIQPPEKENEKIKKPEITTVVYPVLKEVHPSKTQPHSKSDSENTKKFSNDVENTNIDKTPNKKKGQPS